MFSRVAHVKSDGAPGCYTCEVRCGCGGRVGLQVAECDTPAELGELVDVSLRTQRLIATKERCECAKGRETRLWKGNSGDPELNRAVSGLT